MSKAILKSYPVITIDGPTGSGKGTIGALLAKKLKWHFLDSGVLYRALAYALLNSAHTDLTKLNASQLKKAIRSLKVSFPLAKTAYGYIPKGFQVTTRRARSRATECTNWYMSSETSAQQSRSLKAEGYSSEVVYLGKDVSKAIRSEENSAMASKTAAHSLVREALLDWQRSFRKAPGLVTDGRDMGTVVFPDALLKIFLIASAKERARRRYEQLKASGISVSLTTIFNDLLRRDERDQNRPIAPLKPAQDAIIIDATKLSIDEVLQKVLWHLAKKTNN